MGRSWREELTLPWMHDAVLFHDVLNGFLHRFFYSIFYGILNGLAIQLRAISFYS